MPQLPDGSEHKTYGELLSTIKADHDRWLRVTDEIAHRAELMGPDAAPESVLDDVRAGRL